MKQIGERWEKVSERWGFPVERGKFLYQIGCDNFQYSVLIDICVTIGVLNMDLQKIESKIYEVRSLKIMLDFDLAELYDVETKVLNQAVKRNIKRFPPSFMFQLTVDEWNNMRSQIVTASLQNKRNISAKPFAFTEHGVTMLASILRSDKAIQMNIAIVEAFIALRSFSKNYNSLANRIKELEQKYSRQFKDVYEALKYLLEKDKIQEEQDNRNKIGY